MRILMVAANYPPRTGGPASSTPVVSRKLMERGHEVSILTSGAPGCPHRAKTAEGDVYRAYELGSGYFSYPAIATRLASMVPLCQYLIRKKKIEVVHVHDMTVSTVAGLFGRALTGVPSIGKYTGDMVYELACLRTKNPPLELEAVWNQSLLNKALFRFEKYALRKYTLIHAPSRYKKQFIESLGIPPEKIRVIPNGIEMPQVKRSSDGRTVFTAARLVPWKGIDVLIRAVAEVKKDMPAVRLKIAGDGPEKASLMALAKTLGLAENIEFTGEVRHDEVYELMAGADVYALPSFYEPAPNAPLEAFSVGTPVVASDVGGIPEVVKDGKNGILVKPKDPQALADAILRLLGNKRLCNQLGREGIKTAKKYEWAAIVDKLEKVYEEMV